VKHKNHWHIARETQKSLAHCTRNTKTIGTLHMKHKNQWHIESETQKTIGTLQMKQNNYWHTAQYKKYWHRAHAT
jgi:hypothetical protein